MHLAADQGAGEGKTFVEYVDYLVDNHWVPPGNREAVDHVRSIGNTANHKLFHATRDEAIELLAFLEMLLKFMYEFPARYNPSSE